MLDVVAPLSLELTSSPFVLNPRIDCGSVYQIRLLVPDVGGHLGHREIHLLHLIAQLQLRKLCLGLLRRHLLLNLLGLLHLSVAAEFD